MRINQNTTSVLSIILSVLSLLCIIWSQLPFWLLWSLKNDRSVFELLILLGFLAPIPGMIFSAGSFFLGKRKIKLLTVFLLTINYFSLYIILSNIPSLQQFESIITILFIFMGLCGSISLLIYISCTFLFSKNSKNKQ
jgi:hypothetical protein